LLQSREIFFPVLNSTLAILTPKPHFSGRFSRWRGEVLGALPPLFFQDMEEDGEEDDFLWLPEPPAVEDVVAAAKTQTDSRRSKKRSRGIEELLLLVAKRCKREDGTVDLEERAAILASAASKADPGFADALTAQRMIRHLQTGLEGQQGSKAAWGIRRTVVEMLQEDGAESEE
jgi:hypothetical protein